MPAGEAEEGVGTGSRCKKDWLSSAVRKRSGFVRCSLKRTVNSGRCRFAMSFHWSAEWPTETTNALSDEVFRE